MRQIQSISALLADHHHRCDDHLLAAEEHARVGRAEDCRTAFADFCVELGRHFDAEEVVLFPAFETATGMVDGPTGVMRREHAQMRELLAELDACLQGGDVDAWLDGLQALNILMQQHNLKEENILYPMCERVLAEPSVLFALRERVEAEALHV